MADRYWVGGTAAWDGAAGTKWSATSGGAGGASVPTSVDDVYFNASSTGTCTISIGNTGAKSINCTGFSGTLTGGSTVGLTVAGSVTLSSTMSFTFAGVITITATATITSASKDFSHLTINGAGITVTLADALLSGFDLTVTQGTFNTGGYSVTRRNLASTGTLARSIVLNNSNVTLSGSAPIDFTTNTNLTFNAGTSTITCSNSGPSLIGGLDDDASNTSGVTFNNVSFTSTAGTGVISISGKNTFNNLSFVAASTAGYNTINLNSVQTINGIFSTSGTAGNRRVYFRGGQTTGLSKNLIVNGTPSLIDADFSDILVSGSAAPIGGTRIGNLGGCTGINFTPSRIVYWTFVGSLTWNQNAWSDTPTGSPNTDFYPLPQDIATFTNSVSVGTVSISSSVLRIGNIDMSARTSAMTISVTSNTTVFGNWINGSGTGLSGTSTLTFAGRNTQTITSAGKSFPYPITIDSLNGSVELADAITLGSSFVITNGTFNTKGFNVTGTSITSTNNNPRSIILNNSTITLSGTFTSSNVSNLEFNSGTSSFLFTHSSNNTAITGPTASDSSLQFFNVTVSPTGGIFTSFSGNCIFNNLTLNSLSSNLPRAYRFAINNNFTVLNTLTCEGATPSRRVQVESNMLGVQTTLNVNTLVANDCDFCDIAITGNAINTAPTRAGNAGNNSGIIFPASKTVYWNLAGSQSWGAVAWCNTSGGTPNINNFPLPQDTAIIDNLSQIGTITFDGEWSIGTLDASSRTTSFTFTGVPSTGVYCYGDWKNSTAVIFSNINSFALYFEGVSTQYLLTNNITLGTITVSKRANSALQLSDSLTTNNTFSLNTGEFDASTYNVTLRDFNASSASGSLFLCVLKMGSGTWTLTGTGTVFNPATSGSNILLYKQTANILLSDNSTFSRTFEGKGLAYNKLTIGGTTGNSTTFISSSNKFSELASTKTVSHTINFGSFSQVFGKWTVTGSAGNPVTISSTSSSHSLMGSCTENIDYLVMGSVGFISTSQGEFYAGANSTGTAGAPVYRTAKPADSTRYWVGGTGNWSDTTKWSDSSGGPGGSSVPRSHDNVIFNSSSNATAYTTTIDTLIRCKSLTITGPASGSVTLAGSATLCLHGDLSLPSTGLTRTYSGLIYLTGSTTGKTITTNGVTLASILHVAGVGCSFSLGSALNLGNSSIYLEEGEFLTNNFNYTGGSILINLGLRNNTRKLNLGSSTITLNSSVSFSESATTILQYNTDFTFNSGTSQINMGGTAVYTNNQTFYNLSFTTTSFATTLEIGGNGVFNNLSFAGISSSGLRLITTNGNLTINGTLTFSAGFSAQCRNFFRSSVLGTTRTLTINAFSGTDVDFRDISVAGAAAPISGTRLGDCKGNTNITFPAGTNKFWNLAAGGTWNSSTAWATTGGGTPNVNNYPLPQDTCIFQSTGLTSGNTITISGATHIGTIDTSARTTNTMTLATGTSQISVFGNWVNGTGLTLTGTGALTFSGRSNQTITSNGRTFTQAIIIDSPSGSVTLADSFTNSGSTAFTVNSGTFDAVTFNLTMSNTSSGGISSTASAVRTIGIGSGTWSLLGSSSTPWSINTSNLTITGTGTISLNSNSAKTFSGSSLNYGNVTLNQGGLGVLTITGDNSFKDITNSIKSTAASTINIGTTIQKVSQFTAAGELTRPLSITSGSILNVGRLIYTGSANVSTNFVSLTGIRAYPLINTWYAGQNSINNGTLGWTFSDPPVPPPPSFGNFLMFYT